MFADQHRTESYQPWLALYCGVALVFTGFVLLAGGFTTSIQAGMAFLDWPLSNGSLNPAGWLDNENMTAEHSHRLLAGTASLLALGAVVWTHLTEGRRWVRSVAVMLFLTILLQALLGGARVLFDKLNIGGDGNAVAQTFKVLHALGAELTLCLWVTLFTAESKAWVQDNLGLLPQTKMLSGVRQWSTAAVILLLGQIALGAVVRHFNYALTIPFFPWLGPDHAWAVPAWNVGVAFNFAHRVGAALVTVALAGLAWQVFRDRATRDQLGYNMVTCLAALGVQIFLGALVIWKLKNPDAATAHLLVGAFLLASTWRLTFLSYRSAWWPPVADRAAPFWPATPVATAAAPSR